MGHGIAGMGMTAQRRPGSGAANWIVRAPGDIERIEARLSGIAYSPHRHDTYAIGITVEGVQSFDYRGATRHSLPGQIVVLHPDELHDGRAGDDAAFRYRTAYIAPARIQEILGGRPLPFLAGGVSSDLRLKHAVAALLSDYNQAPGALELQDALYEIAKALENLVGGARPIGRINRAAAQSARDYIEANVGRDFSLADLERAAGRDRWQLSRDFRAMFGTSPYRYLIARRLERARGMMLAGDGCAEAAHASGFADQSHFGRLFKKAYGMTPAVWLAAAYRTHNRSIPAAPARPH